MKGNKKFTNPNATRLLNTYNAFTHYYLICMLYMRNSDRDTEMSVMMSAVLIYYIINWAHS